MDCPWDSLGQNTGVHSLSPRNVLLFTERLLCVQKTLRYGAYILMGNTMRQIHETICVLRKNDIRELSVYVWGLRGVTFEQRSD